MRAVKGKNRYISLLNRAETQMFNNVDMAGFLDISTLDENSLYIAEEMFKKNLLKKVKRGDRIGYKIYPQQEKL